MKYVSRLVIEGVNLRTVGKVRNSRIFARMERRDNAAADGKAVGKNRRKVKLETERRQARKNKAQH